MVRSPCYTHHAAYYGEGVITMRSEIETQRYQKVLAQYRDKAKATIATTPPNSEAYTEAIKVFLRCDGAIEALNWTMDIGVGDFSVSPGFLQRQKN
jgi:hypothetical protein